MHTQVFERSSLPNLGPRARSVAFDSQRPYPQRADFLENSESKVRPCAVGDGCMTTTFSRAGAAMIAR